MPEGWDPQIPCPIGNHFHWVWGTLLGKPSPISQFDQMQREGFLTICICYVASKTRETQKQCELCGARWGGPTTPKNNWCKPWFSVCFHWSKHRQNVKKPWNERTELVTTPPWWFFWQGCPGERLQPAGHPTHGHKVLLRRQVPLPLLLNPTGGAGHPRLLQQPAQTPEKSVRWWCDRLLADYLSVMARDTFARVLEKQNPSRLTQEKSKADRISLISLFLWALLCNVQPA